MSVAAWMIPCLIPASHNFTLTSWNWAVLFALSTVRSGKILTLTCWNFINPYLLCLFKSFLGQMTRLCAISTSNSHRRFLCSNTSLKKVAMKSIGFPLSTCQASPDTGRLNFWFQAFGLFSQIKLHLLEFSSEVNPPSMHQRPRSTSVSFLVAFMELI